MLVAQHLTKRYGQVLALDDVTFALRPGMVTGFLGPNGSGKSTTMRCFVGLDAPTSGRALVNGRPFAQSTAPLRELGALLDAGAFPKGRSARNHLRVLAATIGVGNDRIDDLLDIVGLGDAAHRSAHAFSLGMRQRLGIAAALIGDPGIVLLDEPANGLDPDGIIWMRGLLRGLAREGRTVFVSSHQLPELERTVDRLIVINGGRIVADDSVHAITAAGSLEDAYLRMTRSEPVHSAAAHHG